MMMQKDAWRLFKEVLPIGRGSLGLGLGLGLGRVTFAEGGEVYVLKEATTTTCNLYKDVDGRDELVAKGIGVNGFLAYFNKKG